MHPPKPNHFLRPVWHALALIMILLFGAGFRLVGLDWDAGTHIHPDERYMTYLASLLEIPRDVTEYFDSAESRLNPFNTQWGRSYVYGTAPLFATRYVADFFDHACPGPQQSEISLSAANALFADVDKMCAGAWQFHDYGTVGLLGRALSAVADLVTILVTFLLARRLFGARAGLLAATFYAFAVLPIQQSHFFTVDAMANLFVTLTLGGCAGIAMSTRARFTTPRLLFWACFSGIFCGIAIACKISVWPLVLLIFACLALALTRWSTSNRRAIILVLMASALAASCTFAAFRVAQPYSFIGSSEHELELTLERCNSLSGTLGRVCAMSAEMNPAIRALFAPSGRWIEQLLLAQSFVNGTVDAPFGIQWANRMPVIFPLINLVFYGLGLPLGIAAIFATLLAAKHALAGRRSYALLPLLLWVLPYFLYQSTQWTKSIRYLLPIYPALCVLVAATFIGWKAGSINWKIRPSFISFALGLLTLLWALAFTSIYRAPNTRAAASEWMYANIPEAAVVANEHWDEPLPVTPNTYSGPIRHFRSLKSSPSGQFESYNEDTPAKLDSLLNWLNEADYIVLSSNRIYGATARLPHRFPLMIEYYRALFAGELGFDLAGDFAAWPRLGPFEFQDQEREQPLPELPPTPDHPTRIAIPYPTAEEAFSVYDHARVLIFRKNTAFSREQAAARLAHIDTTRAFVQTPLQAANSPNGLLLDATSRDAMQASGTWADLYPRSAPINQSETLAVLIWLLLIETLGLATWPLIARALDLSQQLTLPDAAWGLSKIMALLLVGWAAWMLASVGAVSFGNGLLWLLALALILAGATLWWRNASSLSTLLRGHWRGVLCAELAFGACFALMLYARSQNPDLWHPYFGGEKPMDFAYFNAVLKSAYFPPYDPWNAGGYINYYYFGWVIFGWPVRALGLDPAVAYNIVLPTVYGCAAAGAFCAGAGLLRTARPTRGPGEVAAGALAVLMALIMGNLDQISVIAPALLRMGGAEEGVLDFAALLQGLQMVLQGQSLALHPMQLYWNATRLHPNVPIAEFPFFTFLYADLHAHMLAMPLLLASLCVAIHHARGAASAASITLGALVVGTLYATNTWDFPALLLLNVAALALSWLQGENLLRAGARVVAFAALAWLFFAPFREHFGSAYTRIDLWTNESTPLLVYLIIYLVFTLPVMGVWLLRGPSTGHIFVAFIGLLIGGGLAYAGYPAALLAMPMIVVSALAASEQQIAGARLFWLIALGAWTLTLLVEFIVLQGDIGRMNTVFKFYMQAWLLLSVVAAVALAEIFAKQSASTHDRFGRTLLGMVMACLLLLGLLYPATALPAKMKDRYADNAAQGLNGMNYMPAVIRHDGPTGNEIDFSLRPDFEVIHWLQDNVAGSPVIMEGNTGWDLYRWGNRMSIYTGLPTVIGWNWHQRQQRAALPASLIQAREDDVHDFYTSEDRTLARRLLDRYRVKYVIVGELERAYYGNAVRSRMETHAQNGLLERVYSNGESSIFRVINPLK